VSGEFTQHKDTCLPTRVTSHNTGHIQTLATKLQDLNDRVSAVRREQQYQREIEATFRDASERVNARAVYWSVWQLVVLVGVAVAEMRYLKVRFVEVVMHDV
jgi:hypothetical protein